MVNWLRFSFFFSSSWLIFKNCATCQFKFSWCLKQSDQIRVKICIAHVHELHHFLFHIWRQVGVFQVFCVFDFFKVLHYRLFHQRLWCLDNNWLLIVIFNNFGDLKIWNWSINCLRFNYLVQNYLFSILALNANWSVLCLSNLPHWIWKVFGHLCLTCLTKVIICSVWTFISNSFDRIHWTTITLEAFMNGFLFLEIGLNMVLASIWS